MKEKKIEQPISYKATCLKFDRPQTETRTVKGYFAAFDTIDSDMDIIRKGAFAKSIDERGVNSTSNRRIKFLHQHNPLEISGALIDLKEDDYGLYFEAQIERTALGDIILERYSNGTYREHSIGYKYVPNGCQWVEVPYTPADAQDTTGAINIQVFECKELNLFEGSVVTFGANPNTPFIGFKGTKEDALKQLNDELKFLIKHAPSYEYELQIRMLYQKQYSLLTNLVAKSTKEESKPNIDYNYIINNLNF